LIAPFHLCVRTYTAIARFHLYFKLFRARQIYMLFPDMLKNQPLKFGHNGKRKVIHRIPNVFHGNGLYGNMQRLHGSAALCTERCKNTRYGEHGKSSIWAGHHMELKKTQNGKKQKALFRTVGSPESGAGFLFRREVRPVK